MDQSALKRWSDGQVALADQVSRRVVAVFVGRRHVVAGILWSPNTVVTAAEAIAEGGELRICGGAEAPLPGETVAAAAVAVDLSTDVAILRAAVLGETATRGDSASLRVGQPVLLAGRNRHGASCRRSGVTQIGPAWHSRRGGTLPRSIRLAPVSRRHVAAADAGRTDARAGRGNAHRSRGHGHPPG